MKNEAFEGMSDYKCSFLLNRWLSLHVSLGKHSIIICFNKKYKIIQLKVNNQIIKLFKVSNKGFEGMSDYKWSFLLNRWLLLHVSQGKHSIIVCFKLKCQNIQHKIDNEIIKSFKVNNEAFEGMSDYKWTLLVNRWLSLNVSQDKQLNIIYFSQKCKKILLKKNNEIVKQF